MILIQGRVSRTGNLAYRLTALRGAALCQASSRLAGRRWPQLFDFGIMVALLLFLLSAAITVTPRLQHHGVSAIMWVVTIVSFGWVLWMNWPELARPIATH